MNGIYCRTVTIAHLFPDNLSDIEAISILLGDKTIDCIAVEKIERDLDLALLSIENVENVKKVSLNIKKTLYGNEIHFFGNTNGYGLTYKEGYVTRPISTLKYQGFERNVFFISNTVNMGESGSPIFDNSDKLVGILSFKMNNSLGDSIQEFSAIIPTGSILAFTEGTVPGD